MDEKIWTPYIQDKVINACKSMKDAGWVSPIKPGCARSVSEAYYIAGVFNESDRLTTLVYPLPKNPTEEEIAQTLTGKSNAIPDPVPGCMIIFDGTYDAVDPPGIGPEDTFTHVGIMVTEKDLYHYSSSKGWEKITLDRALSYGWKINSYRLPKSYMLEKEVNISKSSPMQAEIDALLAAGIINTRHDVNEPVTWGHLAAVGNRIIKKIAAPDPESQYIFENVIFSGKLTIKESINGKEMES